MSMFYFINLGLIKLYSDSTKFFFKIKDNAQQNIVTQIERESNY